MPERIQLSRAKGWRMPPGTIKVARPSKWGNPFTVEEFGRDLAIALYRNSVQGYWSPGLFDGRTDDPIDRAYALHTAFRKRFFTVDDTRRLRGWNLACWCKPGEPCHADVLLELANPKESEHG